MSLFSTAPQLWDQPAAAVASLEQSAAAADGTRGLGRLGSSYLDTDYILDGCPSRDTFLLPDDADDLPMPAQQHNLSTPSTQQGFPPFPYSQTSPAGQTPCRSPAQLMRKSAGGHALGGNPVQTTVMQDTIRPATPHNSAAWDKASTGNIAGFSTSMGLVGSSGMLAGHSPLVSAHTAAALMAVDDDLQHASLADMLGLDSSALMPLEGSIGNGLSGTEGSCSDLLWGPAGVPEAPPTVHATTGHLSTSGPGIGAGGIPGGLLFPQQQQQQQGMHSPQQRFLQVPSHRQAKALSDASATLGAARALVGAVYQSPPRQGRQLQGIAGGVHQQHLRASPHKGRSVQQQQHHLQQQQQLWTGAGAGTWLQQQAYPGAQQQQQVGTQPPQHSTNSSSARSMAHALNPHPADPRVHLRQLPAGTHSTQQQQQQFLMPHEQQHRQQGSGCMSAQQHMHAHHQALPDAAAAELHTWGSNASSVTVAVDAAASPADQDAAAAVGGQWTASPVNTAAAAAAAGMHGVAALHYPHMSRAGSVSSDKATHSSPWQGALSVQACGPAAAAAASDGHHHAHASAVVPQQQQQQQQQQSSVALLQELLALQQQHDSGSAAASPGGITGSPAAAAAAGDTAVAVCTTFPAVGGAAAAAAAAANSSVDPSASAGALATAVLSAVPPGHPNSGAAALAAAAAAAAASTASILPAAVGTLGAAAVSPAGAASQSLNSANSGSVGDSSHDSSQTQQQDAGSTEQHIEAAAAATAAGTAGVDANGVPQPRIFHHKGGGPCDHCGVMESPQWRRGPPAKPILCNACGTRYRRTHHLGPPIPSTGRVGGPRPPGAGSGGLGSNGSGGGSTPGRKRVAAAEALGPAPLPVNLEGGVHTGTRLARNPHIRPTLKHYRSEDYEM